MANNRMVLVCKKCQKGIAIAKYYPLIKKSMGGLLPYGIGGKDTKDNSGWYTNENKELYKQLDAFFIRHKHNFDRTSLGGNQYFLTYESADAKWTYEKLKDSK